MPLSKPSQVASTQDGGVTVVALADGGAIAIDSSPKTLWERRKGVVLRCAVSQTGESLLLERDPSGKFRLVWLGIDGFAIWQKSVSSETRFAFSERGQGAIVLDGRGILIASRSFGASVELRRAKQPGLPVGLVVCEATGSFVCALSNPHQIALFSADGTVIWRKALSEPPHCIAASSNFSRIALVTKGPHPQLSGWDAEGQLLWSAALPGRCERLMLSPEGSITLVQCAVALPGTSAGLSTSHLVLRNSVGKRLFEKGGVLINPQALQVATGAGSILCWDPREGFVVYDSRGREIWHAKPEPIATAWSIPHSDLVFTWRESAITCWRANLTQAR